ncbi:carbamoyltransferase HypF [Ktedonobacter racemifer]|uniref:Carbamoyltransferase n=1 Tax=Ktedonobacter racemifer DSM 44963 TaxID=485913 RepID=D6TEX7_KTERA|nr:carbamoyltransferase HypF [Ktedonobacter racemifer]EFH88576.1 (NiFe) hydrogenase maturation protein HypF [Ktedonobacter racemifer DSM 44963]
MATVSDTTIERRRLTIRGIVQGVGFRPFVYTQAIQCGLTGFVLNNSLGVTIEVEGVLAQIERFQHAMRHDTPPLAHVDTMEVESIPLCNEQNFRIAHSEAGDERQALISPDCATCPDCLRELFTPGDRRFAYPFINCTNCGPRFTIIQDVPYDREKTTMRAFTMCPACQAEYEDPANRRFHAQPNACPVCGPHVQFQAWQETQADLDSKRDQIALAAEQLAQGVILAIKGLGGYHLACDACNAEAVQRLRQRKRREAKPFALMVPDIEIAQQLCHIHENEATLLQSHRRPIVLLDQLPKNPVASGVAPGYDTLGLMLPYTPLHHLLLRHFRECVGAEGVPVLVMTSGNLSEEPIAYRDADARTRLAPIAEGMLSHNREIHMRTDDSVARVIGGGIQFLRRARGYVPEPIALSFDLPVPLLACGGHLKNTFCVGKQRSAFLSHHIGDLENWETLTSFREGITHFQRLFDIEPQAIAYDLHPEYLATKYALETDISQKIGVQHHHAHITSVMAEHQLEGSVLGIAADGTGYGTDGAIWGCEIMEATLGDFTRLAHLAYVPLPGGEQAIRQPWRMAAVYLDQAFGASFPELPIPFTHMLDRRAWRPISQMIERQLNSPATSSLGRLFDAVAALLGLRREVLYEGQAAIELEILAHKAGLSMEDDCYPFAIQEQGEQHPRLLNVAPTIRAIVEDMKRGESSANIAARFHHTIAEMLATICCDLGASSGQRRVALSGGVFQNRFLLEEVQRRLEASGFHVYVNRQVPPNDGGLCLGQLATAAARLRTATS